MSNLEDVISFMGLSPEVEIEMQQLPETAPIFKKNVDNYLNYLKSTPLRNKYFPLDLISKKIGFLLMFSELINKYPEGLEETYKSTIEKRELKNYAIPLMDYIFLEIRDFYRHAYFLFEKNKNSFKKIPDFPTSASLIKKFRDNVVGHIDAYITQKELVEFYEEVNNYGGFHKLYSEWQNFRDETFKWIDGTINPATSNHFL